MVVLAVDGNRIEQKREERLAGVEQLGIAGRVVGCDLGAVGRLSQRTLIERCVVSQGRCRHLSQDWAVKTITDPEHPDRLAVSIEAWIGDPADDRGGHLPAIAQLDDLGQRCRRDDGEHPLLALRGHDLPGLHPRLSARHRAHVDVHAHSPARRCLRRGARQTSTAEVLDTDDEPLVEQREAGLDQPLLLVGVADLGARPLGLIEAGRSVLTSETGRGEHRHAADAVSSGGRAEQHRQVPHPRRDAEHQSLDGERTHAEHVDERVGLVAPVEGQLATHRRDADRVAVPRDARHHALDEPALPRVIGFAEEQRVHDGQRARTHREDVAEDPADTGGGSLVRLDGGGMVVALNPDRHRDPIASVDDTGILAWSHQDRRAFGGEALQVDPRRLVRAVLRPHHPVEGELEGVGLPTEHGDDVLELSVGQPERLVEGLLGSRRRCHRLNLPAERQPLGPHRPARSASRRCQDHRPRKVATASVTMLMPSSTSPLAPRPQMPCSRS